MKTPFKNKVYLFISALGLFIGGIGISLVHGVDHPNSDNTRTPAVELIKRKQTAFYNSLREAMRIDDAPGARSTGAAAPATPTPAA